MMYKWIGAILIVASCGGFGFLLTLRHKQEETALRQLIAALDFMECELQYRLTPLPELCRQAARQAGGQLQSVFQKLGEELDYQIAPDVESCMGTALAHCPALPDGTRASLTQLGKSLGRFDLQGQIQGLESVRADCRRKLDELAQNRENRLRSYQTLGLCAGAALAILFI